MLTRSSLLFLACFATSAHADDFSTNRSHDLARTPATRLQVQADGTVECEVRGMVRINKKGISGERLQLIPVPPSVGPTIRTITDDEGFYSARIPLPASATAEPVLYRERVKLVLTGSVLPLSMETPYVVCGNANVRVGEITRDQS